MEEGDNTYYLITKEKCNGDPILELHEYPLNYKEIPKDFMIENYDKSENCLFIFGFNGIFIEMIDCYTPTTQIIYENSSVSEKTIEYLKSLCSERKNTVYIVTVLGHRRMKDLFSDVKGLNIIASGGRKLMRVGVDEDFIDLLGECDTKWKQQAKELMEE